MRTQLPTEIRPGKKFATRLSAQTQAEEPVVEGHVREVYENATHCTLAGVERGW